MGVSKSSRSKLRAKSQKPVKKVTTTQELATAVVKKQTKIERQLEKSLSFNNKITKPQDSQLSKSALKRRRKAARDALKTDLGSVKKVLVEELADNFTSSKPTTKNFHIPNPHKSKKGQLKIEKVEKQVFNSTLNSNEYRESPFASLKNKIQQNLSQLEQIRLLQNN